jgi:26S proteasome regulatory subunit T2
MGDKPEPEKKKKPAAPVALSAKRRRKKGSAPSVKIPQIFPTSKCKLRLLKLERVKDFLLMEEEFIQNQEIFRPRVEQNEVSFNSIEGNYISKDHRNIFHQIAPRSSLE